MLTPFLTLRFYEIYKGMTEECIEAGHQAEFSKLCVKSVHLQVRGVVDSELCHVEVSLNIWNWSLFFKDKIRFYPPIFFTGLCNKIIIKSLLDIGLNYYFLEM